MDTAEQTRHLDRAAALRDGTPVRVRAIRADDRQRLVAGFGELDADAVYARFHGMKKSLTDDELRRLTQPDFERSVVLVLELHDAAEPTAFAVASCNLLDDAADTAEVSFTVAQPYRGRGAASVLLATFIDLARARGLKRLVAEVLATNVSMLAVFNACGRPVQTTRTDNELHVVIAVDGAS